MKYYTRITKVMVMLIQGIKNVRTKYFCIFNADGSFNPIELDEMYKN